MAQFNLGRLLPLFCSLVALILGMLALFAGNGPNVLEEYDIITVDTSSLEKELVRNITDQIYTLIPSTATSTVDKVSHKANDIISDIIDKVTERLHISGFYSLHALSICEGDFLDGGVPQTTECHHFFSGNPTTIPSLLHQTFSPNLTDLSDLDLPAGFQLSLEIPTLADLGLNHQLEDKLNNLNDTLRAFAIIFAIGIGLTGLSFLLLAIGAFPACNKPRDELATSSRMTGWEQFSWYSALAALFLLVLGGLVGTIGAVVAARDVRHAGEKAGVSAAAGLSWVTLTWVAIALMTVEVGYWTTICTWPWSWACVCCRGRGKGEKHGGMDIHDDEEEGFGLGRVTYRERGVGRARGVPFVLRRLSRG